MGAEILAIIAVLVACYAIYLALQIHSKGWGALSKLYPNREKVKGKKFLFSIFSVQPAGLFGIAENYSFCTSIVLTDKGIGLAVPFPFHSSLLIPWHSIRSADLGTYFLGSCKLVTTVEGYKGRLFFFFRPAKEVFEKWSSLQKASA